MRARGSHYLQALPVEASEAVVRPALVGLDHSDSVVGSSGGPVGALGHVRLELVQLMGQEQLLTCARGSWTRSCGSET